MLSPQNSMGMPGIDGSRERIHIHGHEPPSESPDLEAEAPEKESRESIIPTTVELEDNKTKTQQSQKDAAASQTIVTDGMISNMMKPVATDASERNEDQELDVTGSLQKDTVYMAGEGPQSLTHMQGSPTHTGAPDSHGARALIGDQSDIAVMTNNISVCD